MTMVSYMSGSRLMPSVNWSPRGGWPVDRSKQWPSSKRCSSSNSAATTLFTWKEKNKNKLQSTKIDGGGALWRYLNVRMMRSLGSNESALQYLLQMDVIQVIRAPDCLHHPALRCDHIKSEERSFWELHEAGNWPWRHGVIGQENNIRLQNKAVKTVKTSKIKLRAIP